MKRRASKFSCVMPGWAKVVTLWTAYEDLPVPQSHRDRAHTLPIQGERSCGSCLLTRDVSHFCEGWGRAWRGVLSVVLGMWPSVRRLRQSEELLLEISVYKATSSETCKFSIHAALCHRGARTGVTLFPLLVCKYRPESKNSLFPAKFKIIPWNNKDFCSEAVKLPMSS